jgi:hypothetical protein
MCVAFYTVINRFKESRRKLEVRQMASLRKDEWKDPVTVAQAQGQAEWAKAVAQWRYHLHNTI